jgi:ABC-2 type transport system ATP-binding protein
VDLAVEASGLKKSFGDTEALRGVDLAVPRATVLGLLGPNGAGKTTTVRILATLLRPDGGHARIDGIDVAADPRAVRARIGLTGQYAAVDERLTGAENLEHVGRLYHLGVPEARRRGAELLEQFDLSDAADRPVKGYSGGMRRRLDIAMSLIARPSVLFLDEPTTGLDPRSRLGMWDLIEGLVQRGTTTVLTTQYLDEAERLADDIAVIDHGEVIARGSAADLKQQIGGTRLTVTAANSSSLDQMASVLTHLPEATGAPLADVVTGTVSVTVTDADGVIPAAVRLLDAEGVGVRDIDLAGPTLDDVFLQLTGRPTDTVDGSSPTEDPGRSTEVAQTGAAGADGRRGRNGEGAR